jgi:hypothetical protein
MKRNGMKRNEMDEKIHAVVATLLDCIARKREKEREIPVARDSPGREKSRDRERESKNCCDQRLYHQFLSRRTRNCENFEPFLTKNSRKICEEKPDRSRKNCCGKERT